jgi:hypothetical protein
MKSFTCDVCESEINVTTYEVAPWILRKSRGNNLFTLVKDERDTPTERDLCEDCYDAIIIRFADFKEEMALP